MRLEAQLQSTLVRDFAQMGTDLREAADQAVVATTEDVKRKGRAEVAQGLSPRASNLLSTRLYPQADQVAAGYFYNRGWWRDRQDILAAYETGAMILPKNGQYTTRPTPACQRYFRAAGGRRRATIELFKAETGLDLRPVKQPNGDIYWFPRRKPEGARGNFRVNARGRFVASRAKRPMPVPEVALFISTKSAVQVKKRINLDPTREYAGTRLAEQLIISLERRGITT